MASCLIPTKGRNIYFVGLTIEMLLFFFKMSQTGLYNVGHSKEPSSSNNVFEDPWHVDPT